MNNVWEQWLEDNYKYMAVAVQKTEKDRCAVLRFANICEKHGVSFKSVMEIMDEFMKVKADD